MIYNNKIASSMQIFISTLQRCIQSAAKDLNFYQEEIWKSSHFFCVFLINSLFQEFCRSKSDSWGCLTEAQALFWDFEPIYPANE